MFVNTTFALLKIQGTFHINQLGAIQKIRIKKGGGRGLSNTESHCKGNAQQI
jgi:hypothetical protein